MICVNVLEAQYSKLIEQNTSYFSCAALFGFECNYDLYIVFKQLFYSIIIILIIYNSSFLICSPDSFQNLACILQMPVSFYSSHFSMLYRISLAILDLHSVFLLYHSPFFPLFQYKQSTTN